jgi:hypothetical protein
MGRDLNYTLIDENGEELQFENRYVLYRVCESRHIGNVYGIIEFYERGSGEEFSFTLEEIRRFVAEKSKLYRMTQLFSGSEYSDDLFTELQLLSCIYENTRKLIREDNIQVSYVHFTYY